MIELRDGEHDVIRADHTLFHTRRRNTTILIEQEKKKKKEKTILKIDRPIINKILHFDITLSRSIMKLINYIYIYL